MSQTSFSFNYLKHLVLPFALGVGAVLLYNKFAQPPQPLSVKEVRAYSGEAMMTPENLYTSSSSPLVTLSACCYTGTCSDPSVCNPFGLAYQKDSTTVVINPPGVAASSDSASVVLNPPGLMVITDSTVIVLNPPGFASPNDSPTIVINQPFILAIPALSNVYIVNSVGGLVKWAEPKYLAKLSKKNVSKQVLAELPLAQLEGNFQLAIVERQCDGKFKEYRRKFSVTKGVITFKDKFK